MIAKGPHCESVLTIHPTCMFNTNELSSRSASNPRADSHLGLKSRTLDLDHRNSLGFVIAGRIPIIRRSRFRHFVLCRPAYKDFETSQVIVARDLQVREGPNFPSRS